MSDIRIPDVAGEILGWRAWMVVGSDPYLRLASVTATDFGVPEEFTIWPTNRWFAGVCVKHGHLDVPHEGCKCGIYAAETRKHLIEYGYSRYIEADVDVKNVVIGVAGLVGKVIPGTQGWKAALARVVRLEVPYEKEPLARKLEALYRVPVGLSVLWKTD